MTDDERAKRFAEAAFTATGRGPMSDAEIAEAKEFDILKARFALSVLLDRHPEWDPSPACPDCGSREHFEC